MLRTPLFHVVKALKELADLQIRTEKMEQWNELQDLCRELLVFAVVANNDIPSVVTVITKILEDEATRLRRAAIPTHTRVLTLEVEALTRETAEDLALERAVTKISTRVERCRTVLHTKSSNVEEAHERHRLGL